MQDFRNLLVWQKAHQLTLDIYAVTGDFPKHEIYGLTSQMRRASSSVPTNLAEGTGKFTDLDFRKYVNIAFGSSNELEYLLLLSNSLHYLSDEEYVKLEAQVKEVKRMLSGLIDKLGKRIFAISFCFACISIVGILYFM